MKLQYKKIAETQASFVWTPADGARLAKLLRGWQHFEMNKRKSRSQLRLNVVEQIVEAQPVPPRKLFNKLVWLTCGEGGVHLIRAAVRCTMCPVCSVRVCSSKLTSCTFCRLTPEGKKHAREIAGEKAEITYEKNGGNSLARPDVRRKVRRTCMKRYGVANPWQAASVKAKIKRTTLTNGGYTSSRPSSRAKIRSTSLERYGVEHFRQAPEVKAKTNATCMERYGVEFPMQNREIFSRVMRSAGKVKTGDLNGRTIEYQGYELAAARVLEARYGKESLRTQFDADTYFIGKTVTSRVDFLYVPKNCLIEVKSTWTLYGTEGWIKKNRTVQKEANEFRIPLRYVVSDGKDGIVILPKDWCSWKKSQLVSYVKQRLA